MAGRDLNAFSKAPSGVQQGAWIIIYVDRSSSSNHRSYSVCTDDGQKVTAGHTMIQAPCMH